MPPEQFQILINSLESIARNMNGPRWWDILAALVTMAGTGIALFYSHKSIRQIEITRKDEFIPILLMKNARPGQANNRFHSTENSNVELLFENHGKGVATGAILYIGDRLVNGGNLVSVAVGEQVKMTVNYTVDPKAQTNGTGIGLPVVIEYQDIYMRKYRTRAQIESQSDGWFDFSSSFIWERL